MTFRIETLQDSNYWLPHGHHHVSTCKQAWVIHDGVKSIRVRGFSLFSFWLFPGFSQNYNSIHFWKLGTSLVLAMWILNQHHQQWAVFPFFSLSFPPPQQAEHVQELFTYRENVSVGFVCLSISGGCLQGCFNRVAEMRQTAEMPELLEAHNWVNKPASLPHRAAEHSLLCPCTISAVCLQTDLTSWLESTQLPRSGG